MASFSNFAALGRGYAVLGVVTEYTQQALRELTVAQATFAESDFSATQKHFASAADLLQTARAEFRGALASNDVVAHYIDVTGTVRSGDHLLATGQSLIEAGSAMSTGMELLLTAQVLPSEEGDSAARLPLVTALEQALVSFEKAHAALVDAEASLGRVTTLALPSEIKAHVIALQKSVPAVRVMLGDFLDQSHVLLSILGVSEDRQYLILFQNNHEIRPTGGFIGSLALVNVRRGVVEDIDVQTVYDGDGQLKEFIAPPDALLPITDRWFLRDANWFVNYPTSAAKVIDFFEKEGGPTVDGVIALTPEVIKGLLKMTGPITMPDYNVVIDENSFVPLTQDLVTYSYDREVNKPKQFLADLTPALLNRVFTEKSNPLGVLSLLSDMANEKQLLVYFKDDEEHSRIARQGWDGSLPVDAPHFLNVVNANIGGHKSDQFMSQEIDYRLHILDDGTTEALVTLRRTHHGPTERLDLPYPPNDNPAYKDNVIYQRVFVPRGAELIEATGFTPFADVPHHDQPPFGGEVIPDPDVAEWQRLQTTQPDGTIVGEEGGYTYFANWIITKPGATSISLYRYRLPAQPLPGGLTAAESVMAYVAKQPGDTRSDIRVEIRLPKKIRLVHTVPNEGVTQTDAHTLVYRGALRRDIVVGSVLEKE